LQRPDPGAFGLCTTNHLAQGFVHCCCVSSSCSSSSSMAETGCGSFCICRTHSSCKCACRKLTGLALHRSGKGCWTMLHVTFKHLLGMTRRHVLRELLNSLMSITGRNNVSAAFFAILIISYQPQAESDTILRYTRTDSR